MAPIDNSRVTAHMGEFVRWWWNRRHDPFRGFPPPIHNRVGAEPVELCEIPIHRGLRPFGAFVVTQFIGFFELDKSSNYSPIRFIYWESYQIKSPP